jgi:hypothetical protein
MDINNCGKSLNSFFAKVAEGRSGKRINASLTVMPISVLSFDINALDLCTL